jgi:hypothetical protein
VERSSQQKTIKDSDCCAWKQKRNQAGFGTGQRWPHGEDGSDLGACVSQPNFGSCRLIVVTTEIWKLLKGRHFLTGTWFFFDSLSDGHVKRLSGLLDVAHLLGEAASRMDERKCIDTRFV